MKKFTVPEFRERVRGMSKALNKVGLPIVRRYTSLVRKEARTGYRGTSIGKKLWGRGKRTGSPTLSLKTIRAVLSRTERAWVGGIKVKGMAAIMEQGGKTAPHIIRPRVSAYLYFPSRSGGLIKASSVRHPGSQIRRYPVIQRAQKRTISEVRKSMETAISKLFAERFG